MPTGAFQGQTVLVTGAGGALGRVLVRALRETEACAIIAVDTGEHRLADLQARVEESSGGPPVRCRLADLRCERDRRRCLAAGPEVVIHAAAYKRASFLDARPVAAAENNLLATAAFARACRRGGVDRFVFVSTDRAARPAGVMGQSKRAAEEWLRAATATEAPPVTVVRLCTLFGSRGSAGALFRRRLRAGRPVPVAQPPMKRWVMQPADGARSVLAATDREEGTYVPTVCIRIEGPTLARRVIRHERPAADPANWMERAAPGSGDRPQEQRWGPEEVPVCSGESGLWRLERAPPSPAVRGQLEALSRACAERTDENVRALLRSMSERETGRSSVPDEKRADGRRE